MKLNMKPKEHIRIKHDSVGGTFNVHVERGILHITALNPRDDKQPRIVIVGEKPKLVKIST